MLAGVVVVVEVRLARVVISADVDDGDVRVVEFLVRRISSNHGRAVCGNEDAHREQVVLVSTAGVRNDLTNHDRASEGESGS
jgi:hypothetical protein